MNLGLDRGKGAWEVQGMGNVNYTVHQMSENPDDQVRQTLSIMRERVAEDSANPLFTSRVRRMFDVQMYPGVRGTGAGKGVIPGTADEIELCESLWSHAKQNIKFQRDEVTADGVGGYSSGQIVETIIRPVDMATNVDSGRGVGDCDDFSMYVACCLKSLGIPCAFATTAADQRDPNSFSHVYVVAYPKNANGMRVRMPIDASHGEYPGWEYPSLGRFQEWPVWDKVTGLIGNLVTGGALILGLVFMFKHFSGRFA